MRTVHALFVGIDEYPVQRLSGCVRDVSAAEEWLRDRSGVPHEIRRLHNAEATRAAVLAGVKCHLGRARPQDTALLWFSGHGSSRPTADPREGTGKSQALVCHDSLEEGGQALLHDGELGALLDAVAARGTHVVAVLDCCFSGGATREEAPVATARQVAWRPWWETDTPGGTRDGGGQGPEPRRHVLLAACRPQEVAREDVIDGHMRGLFSHAVLGALDRLYPSTTYSAVHALAEERVRSLNPAQHPELRGADQERFLDGRPAAASPFLLRHTASGWEINCGYAHGLQAAGTEFIVLDDGDAARAVVVREVRPESARVEPVDWCTTRDDMDQVYAVTPSALAFPPASVAVTGDPASVELISNAIAGEPALSGTGGGVQLSVTAARGRARVLGGGGHPLPDLPLRSVRDTERLVDCLTHIVRWHRIRDLVNPDPWLSALIRVSVEGTAVGSVRHRADGEIVCEYAPDGREPQVMVRVHNQSGRDLWVMLLDLTDSYGSSPHLYEGDFVSHGHAGMARRGEPVWLRLPPGRTVTRGAHTRDWFKVIVTENELNPAPFKLPPWSPDTAASPRGLGDAGDGLLRFTALADGRDAGGPGPAAAPGRWGTTHVVVRTEVP
ncbi:caspase family protein [Streptomyces sp. NPDC059718]